MTDATMPGTTSSPNAQATPLREEVTSDAARLAHTAKDRIDQVADGQKQAAAGIAKSATSAIDRAVNALREDDQAPDWLTKAFESTARQVESFAGSIEGKKIDDLRRDLSQFARSNPMAFLAVSAAAGFAAARFLRAGSEYKSHQPSADASPAARGQSTSQAPAYPSGSASSPAAPAGTFVNPELTA